MRIRHLLLAALAIVIALPATVLSQSPSFYSRKAEWPSLIDSLWGMGDPLSKKQEVFNLYADRLERKYPMFGGVTFDWDSLRSATYARITGTTSRAAFSALMTHFAYSFREIHTRIWDLKGEQTPLVPGTPIFLLNISDARHFGASLTTTDDGWIMVVSVLPNHPLGLAPGDLILGYEGVAWSQISRELFDAEVPLGGHYGSSDASIEHTMKTSAGINWHMFDTIDIVKHSSGDTVHLSTAPMASYTASAALFNAPMLPVPGVPMPNFDPGAASGGVSSGIVSGTNVGYVYVTKHTYNGVDAEFGSAVTNLLNTDGLIIDLRYDAGGSQPLYEGMSQLFGFNFKPLQILVRCDSTNIDSLCQENYPLWFNWNQNDTTSSYDRPIAVLIGPNAKSFGDIFAHTMSFHPRARFFGRPTDGGFGGQLTANALSISGWNVVAADFTMTKDLASTRSSAREPVPVDEAVWLTRGGVAQGQDDVVQRALQWIQQSTTSVEYGGDIPLAASLDQNYPNPFNPSTTIRFRIAQAGRIRLTVVDMLGREVAELLDGQRPAGTHSVVWHAEHAPSGVYFCRLATGEGTLTQRLLLVR